MHLNRFVIIASLCAAGASLYAGAPRLTATPEDFEHFSIVLPDSLPPDSLPQEEMQAALSDTLTNRAAELYRQVMTIKMESMNKDSLYQTVYQGFEASCDALGYSEPQSTNWQKARNQLLGLDPELERGAYFYSSINNSDEMGKFAMAFIDVQLMEEFKNHPFTRDEGSFPLITYIAASRAYNTQQFERAIEYFKLYFSTGEQERRQQVYLFMGQACLNAGKYDLAVTTMRDAMRNYPHEKQFLMIGMQACQKGDLCEYLNEFLDPALALTPDDELLLQLKGKLLEDANEYMEAIQVYTRLDELYPMKLNYAKHLALSYYNYAVFCFNDALNETSDEKKARRLRDKANTYFSAATMALENVLGTDPMAVRYLKALGVSYLCLGEKGKFDSVNQQLTALGEDALADMFMPPKLTFNEGGGTQLGYGQDAKVTGEVPLYSEFARDYITQGMLKWAEHNEFNTTEEYLARVNDTTIKAEKARLELEAQQLYQSKYSAKLILTDLKLKPYDANNQTFLIESSYGPITLKVPLADNEAERFKSTWEGMRFSGAEYFIVNDQPQIGKVLVTAPSGKTYQFDNSKELAYASHEVDIDWNKIFGKSSTVGTTTTTTVEKVTVTKESDVDKNIPQTNKVASRTFALIIANENYENTASVESALHDGERFADYCRLTLGLPSDNVKLLTNATYGHMVGALSNLKKTVNAFDGNAEVIVYYAGHGIPDDSSKDAFLMPVDATPTLLDGCYSLDRFYTELNDLNSKSVMVFLDACFSGATRDDSPLVAARGVQIVAKETVPKGNMFVLSAASGGETALPYKEMNHGLFTYYLLKKLQDSKGNVTLKDLSDYVITQEKQQSILKNQKPQTPTVRTSGNMQSQWTSLKMLH